MGLQHHFLDLVEAAFFLTPWNTVNGCKILHHWDGRKPINNGIIKECKLWWSTMFVFGRSFSDFMKLSSTGLFSDLVLCGHILLLQILANQLCYLLDLAYIVAALIWRCHHDLAKSKWMHFTIFIGPPYPNLWGLEIRILFIPKNPMVIPMYNH